MSARKARERPPAGSRAQAARGQRRGLPQPPHPLVDREKDLKTARSLLLRSTVRLVTISGPPGVGKTRFTIELASIVAPEFDEGVVFVDLAPVRDPGLVLDAIARALGVIDLPDRPALQRLKQHLANRNILIVLDNFEQVIAAAADVADVLAAGSHIKMLVTSRQPLNVRWEHRYGLLPLALPEAAARVDQNKLKRSPAIALFLERARAVDSGFSIDERNVASVVEICRRLDGLPLAIELAAAWIGVVGLDAIQSRPAEPPSPSGPRDAPERQRTLVDAIGWSFDLLNETERRVFRALGAFAGETPLEAIEVVCAGLRVDILTPIAGLVDKNLLVRSGDGETSFRMLETIREFAEERLTLAGEADVVRRRHAAWFLEFGQRAYRFIWSEHQAIWLDRVERAHANIRVALEWCLSGHDEETGALLAAAMHRFWFARGYIREGRRWCETAASAEHVSAGGRALALRNLAFFLVHQGETGRAVGLAEEAAGLAGSVDDPSLKAWVLWGLTIAVNAAGDRERGERLARDTLDLARQAGDDTLVIRALLHIGNVLHLRGDAVRARAVLEEALTLARPRHDKWLTSVVTGTLGRAIASEDSAQALVLLEEGLSLSHEIGHPWLTVRHLEHLAGILASSDRGEVAATLLGVCETLRDSFGFAADASKQTAAAAARERLGPAAFEAARHRGKSMTVGEAVALALGRTAPARVERAQRPGGLSGREVQIAQDIAGGLTNRQIAEKLGISERTVDAHVQNIRNKLGIERRPQIAAWASRHLPE